jgi:hypothetical protein
MRFNNKYVRYSLIVVLSIGIGGLIGTALLLSAAPNEAQESPSDDGERTYDLTPKFDNIEDAEAAAGFNLYEPTFIPDGFQSGPIFVKELRTTGHDKMVMQTWTNREQGGFITVHHTPGVGSLAGDGRSVTVRGTTGKIEILPSVGRPAEAISLYWSEDGIGFLVTGLLIGSVTEDTILKVAESMEP